MVERRQIDWRSAQVKDGELNVELTGEPSGGWSEHMEGVVARLDARRAATIKVRKRRIRVAEVTEDGAEELRHLLESAVQQTNADLVDETRATADAGEPEAGADDPLTAAFRAFAGPEERGGDG